MRTVLILASIAVALSAAPASARARDEVMVGAYRCAGIAAARIWLECYYGAAQPVRTELALAPAPEGQVRLSLAPPAEAGEKQNQALRDDVMASAGRCGIATSDREWLNCYYAAAVPIRVALGLSVSTPQVETKLAPAPNPPRRKQNVVAQLLGAPNTFITSRMMSYNFDSQGKFTVALANGQVWRQVGGGTIAANWRKPAPSYLVTITGGAIGSYNFTVQGSTGKFKVRRVS